MTAAVGSTEPVNLGSDLDWEERDESTHFSHHVVAGASAGIMEHVAMFPLDTVKTRMQAFTGPSRTTFMQACDSIYSQHGMRGFVRGAGSIAGGCIPAHIGLFTVYERMMNSLKVGKYNSSEEITPVKAGICGATAQFVHDAILCPIDLIKQRLQLGCYRGFMDCMMNTYRQEGLLAFYRSLPVSLTMTVPSGGIFVSCNETLKTKFHVDQWARNNPDRKAAATAIYFGCAGVSGMVSAFVTQPLDMIKTRIQTQDILLNQAQPKTCSSSSSCMHTAVERPAGAPPVYRDVFSATKIIYKEIGVTGFWRGAIPRMAFVAPSAGLCWGTYELVKSACNKASGGQPLFGIGKWHA